MSRDLLICPKSPNRQVVEMRQQLRWSNAQGFTPNVESQNPVLFLQQETILETLTILLGKNKVCDLQKCNII